MGRVSRVRAGAGSGPPLCLGGLVRGLRALIPEATVAGGCFGQRLPHPRVIPREERHAFLRFHQESATQECLHTLLDMAGLPPVEPARLPSGARSWPMGHVGSVSHKGTRVVAALAREEDLQMVGIDIAARPRRWQRKSQQSEHHAPRRQRHAATGRTGEGHPRTLRSRRSCGSLGTLPMRRTAAMHSPAWWPRPARCGDWLRR